MKIKIKIKTILLLILVCLFIYLVIIPIGSLEIANYLDRKGSDKSLIFYENFLSKSLLWNRSKALYEYASGLIGNGHKFQLMMMGWGGGDNKSQDDMKKGIEGLEEILHKEGKSRKDREYMILAYPKIMNTYVQLQDPENLLSWIDWGRENNNEKINYISDLYQAYYYFANRQYDLAEEVLDKYSQDMLLLDYRYFSLKGELALWQGDKDLARKYFLEARDKQDSYLENNVPLFASHSYDYRWDWLDDDYSSSEGHIKVRGKVEYQGRPVPFVEIYLRTSDRGFRVAGGDLVGMTDINGEYETLGFKPGKYELGLGLSASFLHNKVYQRPELSFLDLQDEEVFNFSFVSPFKLLELEGDMDLEDNKFSLKWEEVPGADHYKIGLSSLSDPLNKDSGYVSFYIGNEDFDYEIKTNKASLDLDKSRLQPTPISYLDDNMTILPPAILGPFIAQSECSFSIDAYDKDSNLLNSTAPLRVFYEDLKKVRIKGSLSQGEDLILHKSYREAIDHYTNILDKEPDNQEALLYLSKIYMYGSMEGMQDLHKALKYSQRYDDLNSNNYILTYSVINQMNHEDRRSHRNLVEKVLRARKEGARDRDIDYNLASYYLSIRDYDSAKESLLAYEGYSSIKLLYIDLYKSNINQALKTLGQIDLRYPDIEEDKLRDIIEKIDDKVLQSKDYKRFQEVLGQLLSEDVSNTKDDKFYLESTSKIKEPVLIEFLDQIFIDIN